MMPSYRPRHKITKEALFSKDFLTFSVKKLFFSAQPPRIKLLPFRHTVAFYPRFKQASQTAVHFARRL
jgi:hypothetical protein